MTRKQFNLFCSKAVNEEKNCNARTMNATVETHPLKNQKSILNINGYLFFIISFARDRAGASFDSYDFKNIVSVYCEFSKVVTI